MIWFQVQPFLFKKYFLFQQLDKSATTLAMGVKGLWSVLEPAAKLVTLDDLKGQRVGVDGPFWMAQAKSTHNDVRRLFYLRIVRMRQVGVTSVVVVFDGKVKPDLKLSTIQERSYNRSRYGKTRRVMNECAICLSVAASVRDSRNPALQPFPIFSMNSAIVRPKNPVRTSAWNHSRSSSAILESRFAVVTGKVTRSWQK